MLQGAFLYDPVRSRTLIHPVRDPIPGEPASAKGGIISSGARAFATSNGVMRICR